ncbi:hypothetical protein N7454_010348 [Penicillium verhagenii]|nr:hypothetical protein N7454_010348 [Penicillium verhagenii]
MGLRIRAVKHANFKEQTYSVYNLGLWTPGLRPLDAKRSAFSASSDPPKCPSEKEVKLAAKAGSAESLGQKRHAFYVASRDCELFA